MEWQKDDEVRHRAVISFEYYGPDYTRQARPATGPAGQTASPPYNDKLSKENTVITWRRASSFIGPAR